MKNYPKPRTCLIKELVELNKDVKRVPCEVRWQLIKLDHKTKYDSKVLPPIQYDKILLRISNFLALSYFEKLKYRKGD